MTYHLTPFKTSLRGNRFHQYWTARLADQGIAKCAVMTWTSPQFLKLRSHLVGMFWLKSRLKL